MTNYLSGGLDYGEITRGGWGRARNAGGQRVEHFIHYQLAAAENTAAWSDLLAALIVRGLDAAAVQMVVSDGSTGLPAAAGSRSIPTAAL
jgi:hypothetical protein